MSSTNLVGSTQYTKYYYDDSTHFKGIVNVIEQMPNRNGSKALYRCVINRTFDTSSQTPELTTGCEFYLESACFVKEVSELTHPEYFL